MQCPLCSQQASHFYTHKSRDYQFCLECFSVFLNPKDYLNPEDEKNHYLAHNNDVNDLGYRNFVSPIVNSVLKDFTLYDQGLDFGSGTGPVISKMLQEQGYHIQQYDPFFDNKPMLLQQKYNYIVCCEVIEHLHKPFEVFKKLKSLLKPGGKLYCMTDLYHEHINFNTWYYKNDPTHVIFYHPKTIHWITEHIGFKKHTLSERLIVFEK